MRIVSPPPRGFYSIFSLTFFFFFSNRLVGLVGELLCLASPEICSLHAIWCRDRALGIQTGNLHKVSEIFSGFYLKTEDYTALHCTALHCTALHCTALHCTALHCTALAALYFTMACSTSLCCIVLHCTVAQCTAPYCTVLYRTALYLSSPWARVTLELYLSTIT